MKFVPVFLFLLVCFVAASPQESKPEPEPEANTSEETPPAPVENDGNENADGKPKCTMFITRMFGRDPDGNGGYFNRRFFTNFYPKFSDRDGGYDGNNWIYRRSYNPYFIIRRGNGNRGRGTYNPTNDQPDPRDIEFVQS